MTTGTGSPPETPITPGSPEKETGQKVFILLAGLAAIALLYWLARVNLPFALPELGHDAGYGLLFILGLLTSVHCIGMCGGITISQTIQYNERSEMVRSYAWMAPSALYNGGRVIAYTLVGALVGALGQAISFPGYWRGAVPLLGGAFMIIMGINLLGLFPVLRRFTIPVPKFAARKVLNYSSYGPLYVGLLTGLMPCGPLQIVQLYALGTGSAVHGALAMLVFSLGTVPLLFSVGAINSLINKHKINLVLKGSALLVVLLGLVMVGRGLSLSGVMNPFSLPDSHSRPSTGEAAVARVQGGVQTVTIAIDSDRFTPIVVQAGIPVRWTIQADAAKLNECNKAITIPAFKIDKSLAVGDNIIEFTPQQEGEFIYTCWMGMIKSKITVVDHLDLSAVNGVPAASTAVSNPAQNKPAPGKIDSQGTAELNGKADGPAVMTGAKCSPMLAGEEAPPAASTNPPQPTRVILIEGMMCHNCVEHVKSALAGVEGVQVLTVEVGKATVLLRQPVTDGVLQEAIEQAGAYKVTSITDGGS